MYASNPGKPESYVANELWKMFRLVELTEAKKRKEEKEIHYF